MSTSSKKAISGRRTTGQARLGARLIPVEVRHALNTEEVELSPKVTKLELIRLLHSAKAYGTL